MNIRSTTPVLKRFVTQSMIVACAVGVAVSANIATVHADKFDDEINALQGQINNYQGEAVKLGKQANDLQATIGKLQAQQDSIQAQINLSQVKYDQLVKQIKDTETKIARNQDVLSETIGDLYVNNSVSPVEMLASSKNIGDYLDQQEFRSSVRDRVENAIKEIKSLKKSLEKKKSEVEIVLADQNKQKEALVAKKSEQSKLLADTQGSQAGYNALIGQQNQKIGALRAQQAAAMAAAGGSEGIVYGSSSYPWMNSSMQYDDGCNYYSGGSAADPWGYCKRQCVSYVAWKLNTDGRGNRNYSGLGNANNWGSGGRGVSWSELSPGDVIIWYVGGYGHVMYVESVSGGEVGISQMNVPYDSGSFSTKTYSLSKLSSGPYEARRFH